MSVKALAVTGASLMLLLAAGCGREEDQAADQPNNAVRPRANAGPGQQAGVTPMADRVAVLGILNKRNGITRDIRVKPDQSVRLNNAIIRLRACETTAPWESEKLTGAFIQLDVQQPDSSWSGFSQAGSTRSRRRSTSSSIRSTTSGPRAAR